MGEKLNFRYQKKRKTCFIGWRDVFGIHDSQPPTHPMEFLINVAVTLKCFGTLEKWQDVIKAPATVAKRLPFIEIAPNGTHNTRKMGVLRFTHLLPLA